MPRMVCMPRPSFVPVIREPFHQRSLPASSVHKCPGEADSVPLAVHQIPLCGFRLPGCGDLRSGFAGHFIAAARQASRSNAPPLKEASNTSFSRFHRPLQPMLSHLFRRQCATRRCIHINSFQTFPGGLRCANQLTGNVSYNDCLDFMPTGLPFTPTAPFWSGAMAAVNPVPAGSGSPLPLAVPSAPSNVCEGVPSSLPLCWGSRKGSGFPEAAILISVNTRRSYTPYSFHLMHLYYISKALHNQ